MKKSGLKENDVTARGCTVQVDPDLEAMWNRFQHLTDKISASNTRTEGIAAQLHGSPMKTPPNQKAGNGVPGHV